MAAASGALVHFPDGSTKLFQVHKLPTVGSEIEPGWTVTEAHIRLGDQSGGQTYAYDVAVEPTPRK
jgi:hypothetical protein